MQGKVLIETTMSLFTCPYLVCSLIEDKSSMYQSLSMPNPYAAHEIHPATEERFGFDWDPSVATAVLGVGDEEESAVSGTVEGHDGIFALMQGIQLSLCHT